jgi:DNA-binding transcriptional ArsR family regulator
LSCETHDKRHHFLPGADVSFQHIFAYPNKRILNLTGGRDLSGFSGQRAKMVNPTLEEVTLLHYTMCQAVSEPRRIMILYALAERPRNVTALAETLDIPQPTVSRHLRLLRQHGLVATERQGTAVTYTLTEPRVIEVLDTMRQILADALSKQAGLAAVT